jgi:CelD/BcsL family acetyltransferase involved in cellulose biosynthesis
MNGRDGFGDRAWLEAWYEAFAPGVPRYPLPIPAADFEPELIPGEVSVLRWRWRFLRTPANSHSPKCGWKLADRPRPLDLSQVLLEALRASGSHGIEIDLLPEQSPAFDLLLEAAAAGRWTIVVEEIERTALVDVTGDWERYVKGLSNKLRKTVNAQERQLQELGVVSFRDVSHDPDWALWLERALRLEAAGWKGRQGSAILQHSNEAQFYRTVAEAAAQKGKLRLNVLTLDDRLIAFQFAIIEDSAFFWLKTAYDEQLDHYGPGSIIVKLSLKECFEDPGVAVFYLPGPGAWKHRWGTGNERLVRVRLAPAGSLVGYLLKSEVAAERLRDRLVAAWRRLHRAPETRQVSDATESQPRP